MGDHRGWDHIAAQGSADWTPVIRHAFARLVTGVSFDEVVLGVHSAMSCLFCGSSGPFTTIEHVIPESMGNDDLLLSEQVCDTCQNYFGKEIERFVLSKTPIGFWRVLLGIRGKERKLGSVDFSVPEKAKGILPQWSEHHDNRIGFTAHADGSTSVDVDNNEIIQELLSGERSRLQFVLSPKHLEQIGRFLGKVSLELLCLDNSDLARSSQFDELRWYTRRGISTEIWPIFHANKGKLKDLRTYRNRNGEFEEDVFCYGYGLQVVQRYYIFSLQTGTDLWVICMNDPYPSPVIKRAYPDAHLELMWYPRDSWTNESRKRGQSQ